MPISEFCKLDVVCCDAGASIQEVAELMRKHHVGDVIVTGIEAESRMPIGILTDRDIVIEAIAPNVDLNLLTAGDIMVSPVHSVQESTGLLDALRMMAKLKVRRMPVVRDDGTLSGIVTADDIIGMLSAELATIANIVGKQPLVESRTRP